MVAHVPNDIFQFSTVNALIQGLATHGPTPRQLPNYGTHGIGTFTSMDGELLFLHGRAWQFKADGGTQLADPDVELPFVQVTNFEAEFRKTIKGRKVTREQLLEVLLDGGADGKAGGRNSFVPFVVRGAFDRLDLRTVAPQRFPGQGLREVAKNAKQWSIEKKTKGEIFGIVSPEWSQGISVAGVHCHFVALDADGDGKGRVEGGHVVDFEAAEDEELEIEWAVTGRFHLGMPRGKEWEELDMGTVDHEGIQSAEGARHAC
ncbi:hypothetical protein AAFC00_000058 [Neodothiora populina]|uniref:Alpha-acetolactate decarboxylase n=1 Tax=Neodothiora populina TaxID=2781224 RepID=A0ABR3P2I5_9PEZI